MHTLYEFKLYSNFLTEFLENKVTLLSFLKIVMEFEPPKKNRKLDFTRPTFNEPLIQFPFKKSGKIQ